MWKEMRNDFSRPADLYQYIYCIQQVGNSLSGMRTVSDAFFAF